MTNEEQRNIVSAFHEIANELKQDFAEVKREITRLNTILEGAGNGGLIADMRDIKSAVEKDIARVEKKTEKLETEFKQELVKRDNTILEQAKEIEKIKARVWTWAGAFAVLVVLANFLLPKLLG